MYRELLIEKYIKPSEVNQFAMETSCLNEIWRDEEGELHSFNGQPATIGYYKISGQAKYKLWYKNGKVSREKDLPAKVWYWEDGKVSCKEWWKDSKLHRDGDNPAAIGYYESGRLRYKSWYKNNVKHRKNNASHIKYNENGDEFKKEWHEEGMLIRIEYSDKTNKNINNLKKS